VGGSVGGIKVSLIRRLVSRLFRVYGLVLGVAFSDFRVYRMQRMQNGTRALRDHYTRYNLYTISMGGLP